MSQKGCLQSTMILVCPNCATRYIVPDTAIGLSGRQVRCASCHHSWFQQGPELAFAGASSENAKTQPTAETVSPPTPPPPPPAPVREEASAPPASPPRDAAAEPVAVPTEAVDAEPQESVPTAEVTPGLTMPGNTAESGGENEDSEENAVADPAPMSKPAYFFDDISPAGAATDPSPFAPQPLFRPRRNPAKLWTGIAIAFFLAVSAAGGALYYFGPPAWAVNMGLMADSGDPDLLLNMPRLPERRKLPSGREYFSFSGQIVNGSDREVAVPPILVELRDLQNRLVFQWTMKPPVGRLKPGQQAGFSESRLDIPQNAKRLTLTFVEPGN